MNNTPTPSDAGYPRFPGDAIIAQRLPSERAPVSGFPIRTAPPKRATASKPLTTIDLLICVVLPPVGIIAGMIRCIRGDPTGWRMLSFSGLVFFATTVLRACSIS
jgi:hypothetical protein